MELHQCRKKGLRKVHHELGYGVVERGVGKKWMGYARNLQFHLGFKYQNCQIVRWYEKLSSESMLVELLVHDGTRKGVKSEIDMFVW